MSKITYADKNKYSTVEAERKYRDSDANEVKASVNAIYDDKMIGVFAALSSATATTVTTSGTYYPILGTFSNTPMQGFTLTADPAIQYTEDDARWMEIDFHAAVSSNANNRSITVGIKKNGTIESTSKMVCFAKTLNENVTLSGTAVVKLEKNDKIQLVCTADAAVVLTFETFTTTIKPFLIETPA